MASIDSCIRFLEEDGEIYFNKYVSLLDSTRNRLKKLKRLQLLETENFDKSKILISVKNTNFSGNQLSNILLHKYHLQMEMTAGSYVLAMTSVADTKEGMDRLIRALEEIDSTVTNGTSNIDFNLPKLKKEYNVSEIEGLIINNKVKTVSKKYSECIDMIAAEYAYVYPPGIPIIVPGERISKEAAELLCNYEKLDFSIEGGKEEGRVEVIYNG